MMDPARGSARSRSNDPRIEARIAELSTRVRQVLQDPDASPSDVERAMSVLVPELQRLSEHIEAAAGPRFARACETCGGLDLRTRWRTMSEAEDTIATASAAWVCRWCGATDFVVLETGTVGVGPRGPRAVRR